ncbi:CU044_2847 family protein [Streptosporangium sp. NPDC051023]|uniref:CU044_2847 family protein n=1 Tax=Streptosporangium sp. NPDC051023 TaxID=3155410 RepID=UPI003451073D
MTVLVRIPLDGGGVILVESTEVDDGPVKARRIRDAVHEVPRTLGEILQPVAESARILLHHLGRAKPAELEVEFGIDLTAEAGAVITKSSVGTNVKVRMVWKQSEGDSGTPQL